MKKFRVGVIGCGAIFFMHAYPLHMLENTEIVAVCDIKPAALETAKQLFNCEGYSDYHELIKRDDIDVAHVLTPHYLHAPMVIEAANAGKHILTEKPMAMNPAECEKMIAAADKAKVRDKESAHLAFRFNVASPETRSASNATPAVVRVDEGEGDRLWSGHRLGSSLCPHRGH